MALAKVYTFTVTLSTNMAMMTVPLPEKLAAIIERLLQEQAGDPNIDVTVRLVESEEGA